MKEKTLNKIIEDIDAALWHLKNEKCNVDTKEKSWETYYGLDNELIDYIRKIEKENKKLKDRIDKALEYINKKAIKKEIQETRNIVNIIYSLKLNNYEFIELEDILKGDKQ